jgi:hypothetical protein
MYRLFLPLVLLALPAAASAQTLSGSRASVERIYRQARSHDLHFHETPGGVRRAHEQGVLVRLQGNANYQLVDVSHPYLLPSAYTFVLRLSEQYRDFCGEKLVVTSAVRPRSLRLANSVDKSVHPTGMAVDLRRPSRPRCLQWLRQTLLQLEGAGVIEAVEERNPPHFHVAVFPRPYTRYAQRQGGAVRVSTAFRAQPAATARAGGRPAARPAGGPTYTVRPGDTLWSIAQRNRVSVDNLKRVNDLRSSRIVAGQVLRIPER